jgi:hypothetical protein
MIGLSIAMAVSECQSESRTKPQLGLFHARFRAFRSCSACVPCNLHKPLVEADSVQLLLTVR